MSGWNRPGRLLALLCCGAFVACGTRSSNSPPSNELEDECSCDQDCAAGELCLTVGEGTSSGGYSYCSPDCYIRVTGICMLCGSSPGFEQGAWTCGDYTCDETCSGACADDDDASDDDDDDDDTTVGTLLFAEDWESHPLGATPGSPWEWEFGTPELMEVQLSGNPDRHLRLIDPANDEASIRWNVGYVIDEQIVLEFDYVTFDDTPGAGGLQVRFEGADQGATVNISGRSLRALDGYGDGVGGLQRPCATLQVGQWTEIELRIDPNSYTFDVYVDNQSTDCVDQNFWVPTTLDHLRLFLPGSWEADAGLDNLTVLQPW